uniref:ShKT domain-containing protein n=1 Tax=Meloidogyne hapla TaxID=6305 RepID=A0A1I8BL19_MELHA
MTPMSTGRRILPEGEKEQIIFPSSQNNNFDDNEIIEKIQKRIKNIKETTKEEEEEIEENEKNFCKDTHELCCFWAVAGECNANPFWMRVKCPMTCGTCGCKVRHANKCKSTGVKCILPTTTTSTEATTTISTSTLRTTSKGPTPPPLTTTTTSIRRRTRPTPPPRMPGHRPQRPKQWKSTVTTKRPKIVSQETEYPPLTKTKNKNTFGDGNGDSVGDSSDNTDNFDNLFNGDYSDEVEEPRIETTLIPFSKHSFTSITQTQIYAEEDLIKNEKKLKGGEKKKKINLKEKVVQTFIFFALFGRLLENVREIQDGWDCIVELVVNFVK